MVISVQEQFQSYKTVQLAHGGEGGYVSYNVTYYWPSSLAVHFWQVSMIVFQMIYFFASAIYLYIYVQLELDLILY